MSRFVGQLRLSLGFLYPRHKLMIQLAVESISLIGRERADEEGGNSTATACDEKTQDMGTLPSLSHNANRKIEYIYCRVSKLPYLTHTSLF